MRKVRVHGGMLLTLLCLVLSACNSDDAADPSNPQETGTPPVPSSPSLAPEPTPTPTPPPEPPSPPPPAPAANEAPAISGTPAVSVAAGTAYAFQPLASDPNGDVLSYTISNKPVWAAFSTTTGALTGTPTAAQVGAYPGVVITASDGRTAKSLAAFSISVFQPGSGVGSATLSWAAPTKNTDGSTLTDLSGYIIYQGLSATALSSKARIANPGITTYVIDNLPAGKHYFAVAAITLAGVESAQSAVGNKTIL